MRRTDREALSPRRILVLAAIVLAVTLLAGAGRWMPAVSSALLVVVVLAWERSRVARERRALLNAAMNDPLTGLPNRRTLMARGQYELTRHLRARRPLTLVMIDLDGFKQLNDRFGHAAGDELLKDVAQALVKELRAQDTVARLGGDEFCVLAPETSEAGVAALTARISRALRRAAVGIEGLSGGVGVAVFPRDARELMQLLAVADERLMDAKRRRGPAPGYRRAA